MDTISLWRALTKVDKSYEPLTENIEVDVLIIGGGITGLTAATELLKSNKKNIAVIESETIGGVTTAYSTGNLYAPTQPYYYRIVKKFGDDVAKSILQSRQWAIEYIANQVQAINSECYFARRPWFFITHDKDKLSELETEISTLKRLGLNIDYCNELPLDLKFKKAARLDNQARFNPFKYVIDLAEHVQKQGGMIFENSHAIEVNEEKDHVIVKTDKAKITAKKVILATHTPVGRYLLQAFLGPYRSYIVAGELSDNKYPECHVWDLEKPHHSICTHSANTQHPNILLIAGNHHKVGQCKNTDKKYQELENYLHTSFAIKNSPYRWSAQHYQAADDYPYVGLVDRHTKHIYAATGYFADGLVYGTVSGVILANIISDKNNDWEKVYNSNRFDPIASAASFFKENSNVFLQYLRDYTFQKTSTLDDVKKGQGKIVKINKEKCAVYRDDNNELHVVSAVCTHMKCIIGWNDAEKTWDCPCHGSRFTIEGEVIEGPALSNLKKVEVIKE